MHVKPTTTFTLLILAIAGTLFADVGRRSVSSVAVPTQQQLPAGAPRPAGTPRPATPTIPPIVPQDVRQEHLRHEADVRQEHLRHEAVDLPTALPVASAQPSGVLPVTTPTAPLVSTHTSALTETVTPIQPPPGMGVVRLPYGSLRHGHGLAVIDDVAYSVDAGKLRAAALTPDGAVRTLEPPDGTIDGVPVKDWIDLVTTDAGGIWLLDRMGDLMHYDPTTNAWRVERRIVDQYHDPSQLYIALDQYNGRAYILDEAQGQVWRWPATDRDGYFDGVDVWQRIKQVDITRAVDIAVDGSVYVLLREEPEPPKRIPSRIQRYDNGTLVWEIAAGTAFERPRRIFAPDASNQLYVIDRDGERVQVLDKQRGDLISSIEIADEIRAITRSSERLYFLGRDAVYATGGDGIITLAHSDVVPAPTRPDEPRWWNLRFVSPIRGAYLPDRDSLIPGSPRLYRFGIHEGLDYYGSAASGVEIVTGTPVYAVADGTILRADSAYQEITSADFDILLDDAERQRSTPATTEARLRGRQVWIDHGEQVVTRYAHLAAVPPDIVPGQAIKAGQIIGYAGNSGTSHGVVGTHDGVHLHFEVRLGEHYLGRWLAPLETRRLLQHIFGLDESLP